ncbi:ATPase [Pseudomonas aeruginosa]|uniref:ATPase n=1 Tax=Pseudomonas aeruginosa TaxID=287 RepID=UPI003FCFB498
MQPEIVMNDKSHVSLEQHVCLVCGAAFDTGAILLDKRLRASMGRHTATGWGLCPEHQKLSDDGFVALVECDPQRSGSQAGGRMKPEQAYRTGRLAHLRRTVFAQVFNVPIADEQACVFVEPGVIEQLQSMTAPAAS